MSAILTGMNIPKGCFECKLKFNGTCSVLIKSANFSMRNKRYEDCPLRSVDGLIDIFYGIAERAEDNYGYGSCFFSVEEIEKTIRNYCKEGVAK